MPTITESKPPTQLTKTQHKSNQTQSKRHTDSFHIMKQYLKEELT
jgi:hypothetical protein